MLQTFDESGAGDGLDVLLVLPDPGDGGPAQDTWHVAHIRYTRATYWGWPRVTQDSVVLAPSATATSPLDRLSSMSGGTRTVTQPTWRGTRDTWHTCAAHLLLHPLGVDLAHVAVLVLHLHVPGKHQEEF